MEEITIKKFLSTSYGDGYGSGSGSGSGYGYGYGSGSGYGYGYGSGSGYGDGYGSGSGSGDGYGDGSGYGYGDGDGDGYGSVLREYNHQHIFIIDDVQTIIDVVHHNYAKGRIVNDDLTTTPCYIAKAGNCFAHGWTLREAMQDATAKHLQSMPESDRIAAFKSKYPTLGTVCRNADLFAMHNMLTGSCKAGREIFCKEKSIDLAGTMTVAQFIELTKDAYGGEIIIKLKKQY